jgi:hypothetical protein
MIFYCRCRCKVRIYPRVAVKLEPALTTEASSNARRIVDVVAFSLVIRVCNSFMHIIARASNAFVVTGPPYIQDQFA